MAEPKSSKRCERSQGNVESPIDSALSRFLERRLKPGERICVGFSGGMDSVVLLHALNRLAKDQDRAIGLSALHVHHGLSERADDWARFCEDFCHRCGVPLEIVRVAVPRDSGEGLEGAARRLRHGVFAACRADWLGLAHHRDDQAETVLLNLLRGAGVAGAAGMLAERPQSRGPTLVRPLLDVPRLAIERYAAEHGLSWIDDESNADRRFRRNFLRHEILPRLETTFSGAGKSLARAAGHFAEAAGLLDDLAGIDREAASAASGRIALVALNELPQARARNLLRHVWTAAGFQAPDTRWIDEALKQLATADALSELRVATAEAALHVYRGELYLVRLSGGPPAEPLSWSGQDILPWAGGRVRFRVAMGHGIGRGHLDGAEVVLKARQGGERLQPDARRPRRSLRNLLQEAAVPPWERLCLPMLWVNGQLAWVGGIGCDAAFACPPEEEGVLPLWESTIGD